jgi:hypothetical protein
MTTTTTTTANSSNLATGFVQVLTRVGSIGATEGSRAAAALGHRPGLQKTLNQRP